MSLTSCITFRSIAGANFPYNSISCLARAASRGRSLPPARATVPQPRPSVTFLQSWPRNKLMTKNLVVAIVIAAVAATTARSRHHGIVAVRQRAERERCLYSSFHRPTHLALF